MKHSKRCSIMESKTVLLSIHPKHAEKILSGEKKIEFRRRWTTQPVKALFLYATAPIQRIVGLVKVVHVTQDTPTQLWWLAKKIESGMSRRQLYSYLMGCKKGVAIQLGEVKPLTKEIDPRKCLGRGFRPPQSFRYLTENEILRIKSVEKV